MTTVKSLLGVFGALAISGDVPPRPPRQRESLAQFFSGLFAFEIRGRFGAFHLGREQARHFWMALALGEIASHFEDLERTRYVALGEIHTGLAKDARVTLARGAGIHAQTND